MSFIYPASPITFITVLYLAKAWEFTHFISFRFKIAKKRLWRCFNIRDNFLFLVGLLCLKYFYKISCRYKGASYWFRCVVHWVFVLPKITKAFTSNCLPNFTAESAADRILFDSNPSINPAHNFCLSFRPIRQEALWRFFSGSVFPWATLLTS